jgi:hypothetical protein
MLYPSLVKVCCITWKDTEAAPQIMSMVLELSPEKRGPRKISMDEVLEMPFET